MPFIRRLASWALAILITLTSVFLSPAEVQACSPPSRDSSAARRAAVPRALSWLHSQQEEDGRVGRSRTVQDAPATADVVLAIALAGENPNSPAWSRGGRSALAALAELAPGYVGSDAGKAGKVVRAIVAAGANPRAFGGTDYIAIIQKAYDSATGLYHPDSFFRHLLAVQGMAAAGIPVPPGAVWSILASQGEDGGWGWVVPVTRTLRADVDTTGRALTALVSAGVPLTSTAIVSATAYLAKQQRADAGWGGQGSEGQTNSNGTALALQGLLAAGKNPESPPWTRGAANPVTVLLVLQEIGGAFVYSATQAESRLLATTDALHTLILPFPTSENSIARGDGCYYPKSRRLKEWRAI
ncbi:MAG: hypothetical protein IT330_04735 [Anaerolineae bacterium]|nr:hypothetical protein [Anaerolineae bacterium]